MAFGFNVDRPELPMSYNTFDDSFSTNKCKVTLKNRDLWKKFHGLETEMIITKSGRRMFPSLQIQIGDMDPQAHYCVFLEMAPASRCRFKYSSAGGWAPAGSEEAQSPQRIYLHPESPAKGEYWMSQPISFGRLKLTNTPAPPAGQVVLSSMHKYQPRIIIVKTSDPRTIGWSPSTCAVFPETQFIAVTAYQNEKITQLKIDNNPFAKGFRENGQAKCKRKRVHLDDNEREEEIICVTDEHQDRSSKEINNNCLNSSTSSIGSTEISSTHVSSSRSRTSSEGDRVSVCSSPLSIQGTPTVRCVNTERLVQHSGDYTTPKPLYLPSKIDVKSLPLSPPKLSPPQSITSRLSPSTIEPSQNHPSYSYPAISSVYSSPPAYYPYLAIPSGIPPSYTGTYYPQYSGYYGSSIWGMSPQYLFQPHRVEKIREIKKPRKLTDFSIRAIIGC